MHRKQFQPAFYAKFQVGGLTPAQQDELLANGWFRNDLSVYASSVKFMGDGWRSCLMLRVPLENFTWKKRLRKLMRRNGGIFEVKVAPFRQTEEKEALWQRFKNQVHGWKIVPELDKHLLKNASPEDFNTWELSVFKDGKLVAFSIFDRGLSSMASLEAAYDPAFGRFSLGVYTMVMEIEFGIREGMAYYYPGFFPKDVPMFEYKLRPGGLEFFRLKEQRWLPWEQCSESDWLMEATMGRLAEVKTILQKAGLKSNAGFGFYPSIPSAKPSPFHYNLHLVAQGPQQLQKNSCLIAWDPPFEVFRLFAASPTMGILPHFEAWDADAVRLLDVSVHEYLGAFSGPEVLAAAVADYFKGV